MIVQSNSSTVINEDLRGTNNDVYGGSCHGLFEVNDEPCTRGNVRGASERSDSTCIELEEAACSGGSTMPSDQPTTPPAAPDDDYIYWDDDKEDDVVYWDDDMSFRYEGPP